MAAADTIERLRQFLRELSPKAQSLLIGELERSLLRGADTAGADYSLHELLLQELRRVLRDQRDGASRIGNTARMVFKPVEPFVVDDRADHHHPGRIARASLEHLWTWIRRDLLPDDAKILTDDVNAALMAGEAAKADRLIRIFQDRVVLSIEAMFEFAGSDERSRRRMLAQIGTPRPQENASALLCILKGRDALERLTGHLPIRIGNLADGSLAESKSLIEKTAPRGDDLFLYALLAIMSRLAAPWQLIRLGIAAAGSDTAARVAKTEYGVTVTIVLAEIERLAVELRDDLRDGRGVAVTALLKTIHDAVRGLRTELELPVDSTWGRALSAIRAQVADLLRGQIETVPGRVRALLRPRPSAEIRPHSVLDADDVAQTEALVELVGACRQFAGELGINEMTQRVFGELQYYLDSGMRALLDGVRHAGPADRSFRQSQADAAVRLCAMVLGPDYASLLGKAAEVASAPRRMAMSA
jgi:hypothetical protein